MSALLPWYEHLFDSEPFTDILLFGDCRAVHTPVHPVAMAAGIAVHVFEEGYVRPHWITMEKHGVNGRSLLPRDPALLLEENHRLPPMPASQPTGYNLYERAMHDIRYRIANTLYGYKFPGYQSHRPHNGFVEYAALAKRFALQKMHDAEAQQVIARLLQDKSRYFLFPLQLNSDSQIVHHSPFSGIPEVIERVLRSFAAHAPEHTLLLIKNHPLDTGLIPYRHQVSVLAEQLGIADRLRYIESGHLPTLLDHAQGVVVVNSTLGLSALHHRQHLHTLGNAIYDIAGLTWQGSLDDFWSNKHKPDMVLYQAFLNYVMAHTQINGDFYTRSGIPMAVTGVINRLESALNG